MWKGRCRAAIEPTHQHTPTNQHHHHHHHHHHHRHHHHHVPTCSSVLSWSARVASSMLDACSADKSNTCNESNALSNTTQPYSTAAVCAYVVRRRFRRHFQTLFQHGRLHTTQFQSISLIIIILLLLLLLSLSLSRPLPPPPT